VVSSFNYVIPLPEKLTKKGLRMEDTGKISSLMTITYTMGVE
jgi:hypothetical protein